MGDLKLDSRFQIAQHKSFLVIAQFIGQQLKHPNQKKDNNPEKRGNIPLPLKTIARLDCFALLAMTAPAISRFQITLSRY